MYTHEHTYARIHICTYAYMHSCASVYDLPSVDGSWDGKDVQDPKGYATPHHKHSLFVLLLKKSKNCNFLNNNIFYHLLGVFMGH